MSDLENLVVGLFMAGSAAYAAGRKLLERRRARKALAAHAALDADTDEGEVVRVTGIVRVVGEPLVSPLSGTECVVYRARMTKTGGLVPTTPRESFAMAPFELERDDGTRVSIEGEHALLDLPSVKLGDDRDRRAKFRALHGLMTNETGTFDEVVVAPGERITVAGLMMKDLGAPPEGESGYRDEIPATLRLAGDAKHPLVIGT